MAKFCIYEMVPQYVAYRKIIEAESLDAALAIASEEWSAIDAEEVRLDDGEVIETLPLKYDAEPEGEC